MVHVFPLMYTLAFQNRALIVSNTWYANKEPCHVDPLTPGAKRSVHGVPKNILVQHRAESGQCVSWIISTILTGRKSDAS